MDLHIKKEKLFLLLALPERQNNSLQILGTLDKPSVEKGN
jgi:hypothetical protein